MGDDEIKRVPFTGTLQEFKDAVFFYLEGDREERYIYSGLRYMYGEMIIDDLVEKCFDKIAPDRCAFSEKAHQYMEKVRIFIPEKVPLPVLDAEWLAERLFDDYFNLDDEFEFSDEIVEKINELNEMIVKEVEPIDTPTSNIIDVESIFRLTLDAGKEEYQASLTTSEGCKHG
jgi:hypothetical protein